MKYTRLIHEVLVNKVSLLKSSKNRLTNVCTKIEETRYKINNSIMATPSD